MSNKVTELIDKGFLVYVKDPNSTKEFKSICKKYKIPYLDWKGSNKFYGIRYSLPWFNSHKSNEVLINFNSIKEFKKYLNKSELTQEVRDFLEFKD